MTKGAVQRISIGFQGGQVLGLRIAADALKALNRALDEGRERWHEIDAQDGAVRIDLGQVVYVRTDAEDAHVGFGA